LSGELALRAAGRRRAPKTHGGLPAWLAMLHVLGDAAWIVDARDLTLAGINQAALDLFGLQAIEPREFRATALMATPEDLAFWHDVQAGRGGRLEAPCGSVADYLVAHASRPLLIVREPAACRARRAAAATQPSP